MFEIPEAKRVRREDLNESDVSGDNDSEADAQIRAQLEAQVARSLGLDLDDAHKQPPITPSSHKAAASRKTEDVGMKHGEEEEHAGPEEYDFCLFGGAGAAPTKVVLEDDSEPQGEGAILKQRPVSFYLAKDLSEEQRQRFRAVAVSGDEVLARSQSRWWNMELPWKVTHITTTKKASSGQQGTAVLVSADTTEAKRKRPGKKRRIALRMKERAEKDKMKTAAQLKEEKEEQLKEKKKRLNRLKKLKRREKEREKKQAAKGGEGAADLGSDSDGSG